MKLSHRRSHRLIWPVLSVLVLLLAAGALMVRPAATGHSAIPSQERPR